MKKLITLLIVVMLCAPAIIFGQQKDQQVKAKIYPNPAKAGSQATVEITDNSVIKGDITSYRSDGYRINFWQTSYYGGQKVVIDIPKEFSSGIYPIRIPCQSSPSGFITTMVFVSK